jgi:hypothetical protein
MNARQRDLLLFVGGVITLIAFAAVAAVSLWAGAIDGRTGFFGLDLLAYQNAADRLVDTGSPYAPELLAGPIANEGWNVAIGYYYPPPLAQLFVPLRDLDQRTLGVLWALTQVGLTAIVLPLVWLRSGGASGVVPLVWLGVFIIASFPFEFALTIGNVSAWTALLVAGMFLARPAAQGVLGALLGLVKIVNAPVSLVVLREKQGRLPLVAVAGGVVAISIVVSLDAWRGWLQVLPHVLALQPSDPPGSVSLASIAKDTAFAGIAKLLGQVMALALTMLALRLVFLEGLSRRVVTTAVAASLLANPTLWDHYLAVMVPIAIAMWPNVTGRWRLLLFFGMATHLVGWVGPLGVIRAIIMLAGFAAITVASISGDRAVAAVPQGSSSG